MIKTKTEMDTQKPRQKRKKAHVFFVSGVPNIYQSLSIIILVPTTFLSLVPYTVTGKYIKERNYLYAHIVQIFE